MQAISSRPAEIVAPIGVDPAVGALARDLNALLCFIHRQSSGNAFAVAEELDLTLTQCKTLNLLNHELAELSVKDVAEQLAISVPAASRTAEALLGRGLLARREDEHDRRVRRIALTDPGREAVERLNGARIADLEQFIGGLSPEQRQAVAAALETLFASGDIVAGRGPTPGDRAR